MSMTKVPQKTITQAVDAVEQAVNSEDAKAAAETRRRARLTGPDCVEFLHHVVLDDRFASPAQRVRSATVLLEAGGFLTSEARETGLFREPERTDGAGERDEAQA